MGIAVANMSGGHQDVSISDEHSLVLACAWLNLKECCLLASKLFNASLEIVERVLELIITVLKGTRHKGMCLMSGLQKQPAFL